MTKPEPPADTGWYKVWDLPVRLFHWSLVLLVVLLWVTGEFGGMDITVKLPFRGETYFSNMDIHAAAGQAVFVLVAFRVLWGIWGSTTARFTDFLHSPAAIKYRLLLLLRMARTDKPVDDDVGHNPLGGVMVLAFLLLLLVQSLSGMFSADDLFFAGPLNHLVSESTAKLMGSVHHLLFSLLQLCIGLHIAAIVVYRLRGENLVTPMFSGRKKLSSPPAVQFTNGWVAVLCAGVAVVALFLLTAL